ncbi:MAG: LacI family DNA-binding transcriptional regulator, partial [Treponema sp.]|nr:LacI family DNA-binding transcriptional regulator [Treponema sp.]
MILRIFWRVSSLTRPRLCMTRSTVPVETPAILAISLTVIQKNPFFCVFVHAIFNRITDILRNVKDFFLKKKRGCLLRQPRVMHNRGRVSDETRQKILKIIDENGYKPDPIARFLKKKGDFKIGVLIPS